MLAQIRQEIQKNAESKKAIFLARFFKTGKGEYAEGDIFLGLTVPASRKIALQYKDLSLQDTSRLLQSKIHDERLIALLVLVYQFQKGDTKVQKKIFETYIAHTKHINNWDLVDLSADKIVGNYLKDHDRSILKRLAKSGTLWERRISIISTYAFIRDLKEFKDTFAIADILLNDKHDLIHKAVGWMLREVGKRISEEVLEKFLKTRYKKMPRTMLRYAIERFSAEKRKKYLQGII